MKPYRAVPVEEIEIPAWAEVASSVTVFMIEKVLTAIKARARLVVDAEAE